MSNEQSLSKFFEFNQEEEKILNLWEKEHITDAVIDKTKKPYCVMMPPPNVTGILHLGHALDNTSQDIMVRWHRMRGYATLWVPGVDHAGIATQNVVERDLKKQGLKKEDLGREKFVERVWEWKKEKGGRILEQLRGLGCSCDWSRLRFTLDDGLVKAVRKAFVAYYEKGLIYRGKKMINYCPRCHTALANDEVEHYERKGHLWYIKYIIADNEGKPTSDYLTVATTRPETLLGDKAVAVNPRDERYFNLHGKKVFLPIKNTLIPVICDDYVDKEFGTGLVKITPAHDPNDYEISLRHNLEVEIVIGDDGTMTKEAGAEFEGLTREQARDAVVKKLEELSLLEKTEDYKHSVGECYRCHTIIEPYLSEQWFLDMKDLALLVKNTIKDGKIEIFPESEKNDLYSWLDNIRDWCISRQLWWGHRIPIFYCQDCGHEMCKEEDVTECDKCGSKNIKQDEDVLDTWFSSQLWPFSTLGWPEKTPELDFWFPTDLLICGRDIIFFWAARMMTASLSLKKDIPFKRLILHGLVRDEHGRKMSKSLGNAIDPLEITKEFGTDALRATMASKFTLGRLDPNVGKRNFEEGQAIVTKLWNATKLLLLSYEGSSFSYDSEKIKLKEIEDKWIFSRLKAVIKEHDKFLSQTNIAKSFACINSFFWSDFCDWYLEIIKQRLRGKGEERKHAQEVSMHVLKTILKLFHPYIPFVTESIWQHLKNMGIKDAVDNGKCLALNPWPKEDGFEEDKLSEKIIYTFTQVVGTIREFRQTLNLPLKSELTIKVNFLDNDVKSNFIDIQDNIYALTSANAFLLNSEDVSSFIPMPFNGGICYIQKPTGLDIEDVKKRLSTKIEKLNKQLEASNQRLQNENFVKNAPKELVDQEKANQEEIKEGIEKLKLVLSSL